MFPGLRPTMLFPCIPVLLLQCLSIVNAQDEGLPPAGALELQPSQSLRVEEQGRGFVVTCRLPEHTKGSNLRWTQGVHKRPINDNDGRIKVIKKPTADNPTSVGLIFNNVQKSDEGLYTCVATIDGFDQDATKEFHLSVFMGISFENVQRQQTANILTDYTIQCNVEGTPAPTIQWGRSGEALDESTSANGKYSVNDNGLTVRNVSKLDGGSYSCDATQMVEDKTSKFEQTTITLVVNYPPEFSDKTPYKAYSFVGGAVNLTCSSNGEPAPEYLWGYRDDSGNFVDVGLKDVEAREDFQTYTYIVKNMTDKSQFRDFICRAKNPLGEAERVFTVEEVEKPPSPILKVHRIRGDKIEYHVTPQESNSPLRIIGYRALIKPKEIESWENATIVDFNLGTTHILDSLSHGTDYEIQWAAKNEVGFGEFSPVQKITTLDRPSSSATGLIISTWTTLSTLFFAWLLCKNLR